MAFWEELRSCSPVEMEASVSPLSIVSSGIACDEASPVFIFQSDSLDDCDESSLSALSSRGSAERSSSSCSSTQSSRVDSPIFSKGNSAERDKVNQHLGQLKRQGWV